MGVLLFRERVRRTRPKREIEALKTDVRGKTLAWLCIRREKANKYHFQGVFVDSEAQTGEELAAAQCLDDTYYIGPLPVNVALPERVIEWRGCYRPNLCPRTPGKRTPFQEEKKKRAARRPLRPAKSTV
jgi:hypothetical protein